MQNNSLLAPRYWPFWLVLGLLRLLILLPFKSQLKLGRMVGRLLMRFPSKNLHTAQINLKLCFPELTAAQRQDLLQKSFEGIGMAIFETTMGWWGSNRRLKTINISIAGLEYVHAAQRLGKGILLCSPHFTTLELAGRLFALQVPIAVMYRPQKKPLLEFITQRALKAHYQKVIARHDIRGMVRALQGNEIIWYAPDVDAGLKNSVFVPFFGIQAATITATSRYAKMTGASVIPAFFYRRSDDSGYDVVLKPPLTEFPSNDLEQDALRINQLFEQAIRVQPDQYLWQYKRFKTRPDRQPRFY